MNKFLNFSSKAIKQLVVFVFGSIILLIIFIFSYKFLCHIEYEKNIKITNITKSQIIHLQAEPKQNIGSLAIKVTGKLNGSANLIIRNDVAVMFNKILKSGKVKQEFKREWYDKECTIEYKPKNVVSGDITIHYKFDY